MPTPPLISPVPGCPLASSSRSPAIVDRDPERPSPTADMPRATAAWQPHYAPLVRLIPSSNRPAPPGLTSPGIRSGLYGGADGIRTRDPQRDRPVF